MNKDLDGASRSHRGTAGPLGLNRSKPRRSGTKYVRDRMSLCDGLRQVRTIVEEFFEEPLVFFGAAI